MSGVNPKEKDREESGGEQTDAPYYMIYPT